MSVEIASAVAILLGILCTVVGIQWLARRTREFQAELHSVEVYPPPQARYGLPFVVIILGVLIAFSSLIALVLAFQ